MFLLKSFQIQVNFTHSTIYPLQAWGCNSEQSVLTSLLLAVPSAVMLDRSFILATRAIHYRDFCLPIRPYLGESDINTP